VLLELRLDRHEQRLELVDPIRAEQLGEEPAHDEAPCLVGGMPRACR
jgi:hypothetical protein